MNINKHLQRLGDSYDRTSYWLILLLAVSSDAVSETLPAILSDSTTPSLLSSSDTTKLFIAVLTLIGVPLCRSFWSNRNEKNAFRIFMKAHTRHTKNGFGSESSVEFARNHLGMSGDWLDFLDEKNVGVPQILLDIQSAITKTLTQESHSSKVWPYVTYLGVNEDYSPIEHDSVIWKLKKEETRSIANYFISQEQVVTAFKTQNDQPYFELIKSEHYHHREQWCQRMVTILNDLAEHYVHMLELRKVLK
ncbi:MAG: hypothetical protein RPS47_12675 [Colwellia sp.]|jgi:hypothetical protein